MRVRSLWRLIHIAARHRADTLFERCPLALRAVLLLSPRSLRANAAPRAVRLRHMLEEIGPIGVKFGQALSTRRDLLPADIADALAELQDHAAPFANEQARAMMADALGEAPEQAFAQLDDEPLASASVAQIYGATLHSGEAVVIKLLRPDLERLVERDLGLLAAAARWLHRLAPASRRLRPVEVVERYCVAVRREMNLLIEAANTSQLRRNFADSPLLYVPKIHWRLSSRSLLVMERIDGVPIDDIDELCRRGVDLALLAKRGVEIFFTQVFHHNFFHADMHPGNIHIDVSDPADPRYFALDCAVMGSLSASDRYYLARNILAVFEQDYRLVAELHVECGWVPSDTVVHELEDAVRVACEPIFSRPLGEIEFGLLLASLFETAREFDMEVQPTLVLLQKTLLQVEGLGRQLYPELDFWVIGRPLLRRWMARRMAPKALYRGLRRRLPGLVEQAARLGDQLLAGDGSAVEAARLRRALRRARRRTAWSLWLAGALAAAWWYWQQAG